MNLYFYFKKSPKFLKFESGKLIVKVILVYLNKLIVYLP